MTTSTRPTPTVAVGDRVYHRSVRVHGTVLDVGLSGAGGDVNVLWDDDGRALRAASTNLDVTVRAPRPLALLVDGFFLPRPKPEPQPEPQPLQIGDRVRVRRGATWGLCDTPVFAARNGDVFGTLRFTEPDTDGDLGVEYDAPDREHDGLGYARAAYVERAEP